jgi:transposase-like protein
MKFYLRLVEIEKRKPINFTNIRHVDEKFIKVRKSKDAFAYLWVVSDSNSNIIAVNVSNTRNAESAKIILRKARERAGCNHK